ncbi:MAG TPA: NAD(P)-binding oxidoreductase [Balneolaceae bacterium]|nr:NAD(P)-binding oxidoreductase [Balneolaceae bacterium]
MKISIAGANGQIAKLLHPKLIQAGHEVRGIIRKEEQANSLKKLGVEPVVADMEVEDDLSKAVGNADAVLFAAGAGPGSGAERKWSVDRDGAIKLMEACKANGIRRYVMISAMGLETPRGSEVFQVYQQAKLQADNALKESGLDYTIVKPGRLTNDSPKGLVNAGKNLDSGEIPRADVASVLAAVLSDHLASGLEFDLVSGEKKISEALQNLKE